MSDEEPATQIALVESPQMASTVKLPILKKGEYTLLEQGMEQYSYNRLYFVPDKKIIVPAVTNEDVKLEIFKEHYLHHDNDIPKKKVIPVRVNGVNTYLLSGNSSYAVKGNGVTAVYGLIGKSTTRFEVQGIFDSGCSRHMTGNTDFFTDYQDIDGGYVTFGGSTRGGKITEKGKIRTDKKNSVLFTETEYLVLSPDFKLLDESQVAVPGAKKPWGGTPAQTRSKRVLEKSIEPPLSEGHTSGSGKGRMKHQFELTANVPITPHDLPLLGGYTPGSDEGRLKLQELMTMCTKLSKQVESSDEDLNDEDASKQGRSSDKTKHREKVSIDQELLETMLNLQLEAEEESIMAFELIKFIKSMLEE
ncbi:hypothetical protein Tco_0870322 [Tanacetum coccineum]